MRSSRCTAWHRYLWHLFPLYSPLASPTEEDEILRSLPGRPPAAWRHKIFIGYVALMVLLFLAPVPTTPLAESHHVDKLVHFGVFLGFAMLFSVDRTPRVGWTLLTSFAFAGAIELVQWVLPYREGDWWDLVAGAAGATSGAVLVLLIRRQLRRR